MNWNEISQNTKTDGVFIPGFSGVASKVKYAQSGIKINVNELIRLNVDVFIVCFFNQINNY